MMSLQKGDPLPHFEQEDQNGTLIKSSDLLGKPIVVYFYPKNFTPGCTKEACDFRDRHDDFKLRGAHVIGVSSDTEHSHKKFAQKYELPFSLIPDVKGKLRKKFGVKSELFGLLPGRETFVFNKKGTLLLRYNSLKASKHTIKALKALIE